MKALLTLLIILTSTFIVWAGDTTGTWVGTMEHKGTGTTKTVWYVKMDLTVEGSKCNGTITYDFMQRNSPLTLSVKFRGEVLENTLIINYYSKDVKKSGRDARGILLQFRYNLVLVKNKFTEHIYGDYIGLSKGLIPDKTKGYIYLEPYKGDVEALTKKIDIKIDSLIAAKDNPPPVAEPVVETKTLPAVTNKESVTQKKEEPKTEIKATVKTLPEKPVVSAPVEMKKDTQVIVKAPPIIIKKDTAVVIAPVKELKLDTTALSAAKIEVQTKLKARENVVTDRVNLDTGEVVVEFYDNGTIDGDIITVIHNKSIELSSATLSDKPLRFSFHIDSQNPYHEIVMYAENQGTIPPNTAMMIITYGNQRKQVFLSADDKKSAVVLLELKKE
ncbi:MAG: hypothetical protein HYX40_07640 [Sphingobacteriales bacterium]|nr:hypothetical protein [Sphingobacteriales bacterium]